MGVYVGAKTNKIANNTCIFGSMSGLPPRVGVPIRILDQPNYGLHCRATKSDPNCCCLPISHTWQMNCKEAKAYLKAHGLDNNKNPTFSGSYPGNRVMSQLMNGA